MDFWIVFLKSPDLAPTACIKGICMCKLGAAQQWIQQNKNCAVIKGPAKCNNKHTKASSSSLNT